MFKAVILAAGRGTRMKQLTLERPKPMLPLEGRPILEHLLDRLRSAGCGAALIVTGYRAEVIEDHLRSYPLPLCFRRQELLRGTAPATLLAEEFAGGGDFLFTFGDILTSAREYRGIVERLRADPQCEAAVGVKWVDDPWQGAAVYEREGVVTRIIEKPPRGESTTHWNSAGLYAFRSSIFPELQRVPLSPRGEYEITSAVAQLLEQGRKLLLHPIADPWRDIGRPEDLDAAGGLV
ncbi:MAG: nucleotidyltransferase family protein [Acidobacteria bacterium]|nr:nucleotidyltransferase family protein [Acidobacteriota bacterium]